MASSSGTSSASTMMQNSGSETDLLDERKRKRMLSNREAARRSRKRKQKQLDDQMAQVWQLRNGNKQIISTINSTRQHYLKTEAENLVLRAQQEELSYRLQNLNQIIGNLSSATFELDEPYYNISNYTIHDTFDGLFNQQQQQQQQQQHIMAYAEMFQY